jgi:hypothetical protein
MDADRIQLNPSARFDDEIARLEAEHNADAVFRLVKREEVVVDHTTNCWVHTHDDPQSAQHEVIVKDLRTGIERSVGLCDFHATAEKNGGGDKAKPDSHEGKLGELERVIHDPNFEVNVVRKSDLRLSLDPGGPGPDMPTNLRQPRPQSLPTPKIEPKIEPPPPPPPPWPDHGR